MRQDKIYLKACESLKGSQLWCFIWGDFFVRLYLAVFIPISNMKKYLMGEKMQETDTQVVDTLPEYENQEQDLANEQVCRGKPLREIDIYVGFKRIYS